MLQGRAKAAGNNDIYIYTRAFRASALLQGEKIVSIGGLSTRRDGPPSTGCRCPATGTDGNHAKLAMAARRDRCCSRCTGADAGRNLRKNGSFSRSFVECTGMRPAQSNREAPFPYLPNRRGAGALTHLARMPARD